MFLTREAILGASDIKTEEVKVPEWGGEVYVRGLSGAERDQWEESNLVRRRRKGRLDVDVNVSNVRARLVALACCDDKGVRMFNDDDVVALGLKSASALARVYDAAARLSGISEEDVAELEKN